MKGWKTTIAGVAAILSVVAKMMQGQAIGAEEYGVLSVGIGLLMAKDVDASHTKE